MMNNKKENTENTNDADNAKVVKVDRKKEAQRRRVDKIFGNDYNAGNLEFEYFPEVKPMAAFDQSTPEFMDTTHESWEKGELRKELYEIFNKAEFRDKYTSTKRVAKAEMVYIYYFFSDRLTKNRFMAKHIFMEIAEMMKMNYSDMYDQLLPVDKQNIMIEMQSSRSDKAKSSKRLF